MSAYDRVLSFLRGCMGITRALEAALVDVIASVIPWLAPVIPAYMVYHNLGKVLFFPAWVSIVGAVVVEFLGLSTVHTTFTFWQYNDDRTARALQHHRKERGRRRAAAGHDLQKRRSQLQQAPVLVAGITAGFYLAVIVTVNVMLDDAGTLERVSKALFSLLGTVAAVTLAIRSQHTRRLEEIEKEKQSRKDQKLSRIGKVSVEVSEKVSEKVSNDWRKLPDEDKSLIGGMTRDQIGVRYGVSKRTANNWYNQARRK